MKMAAASNPLEAARDVLLPLISRPKTIQNAALGFISETAIEYRSSTIVADYGGDGSLNAGDRMPDVDISRQGECSSLLHDWTDGRHLAVLINATDLEKTEIESELTHATAVSINAADLDDEGRRLLGNEKTVFVVRPDGYIGFRGPPDKRGELGAYAAQDGLRQMALV
jgi:hypothetical protein